MTDTNPPTYAAVIKDLGIDPDDYTENSHRVQPDDHAEWMTSLDNLDELAARRANPGPTKARRPAKKAANR